MDPAFIAICAALTLQFVAAFIAVRLIIVRGRRWAGSLMLLAALLMVFGRFLSLYRLFETGEGGVDLLAEGIGCVLSLLLVLGFLYISRLLEPIAAGPRFLHNSAFRSRRD